MVAEFVGIIESFDDFRYQNARDTNAAIRFYF